MRPPVDDLSGLSASAPQWFRAAFDTPRKSGTVDVEGCPIHYFRWGNPEAPPVLLTHGFLAHARLFAFVAPALADRFHVVAFDLSGMGDSGHRPEYGDRAPEAFAVAEATGLFDHPRHRPIFVTHSFGGTVAISTLEKDGDRFGGVIVCDLMMMRDAHLEAYLRRDDIARLPPARALQNKVYPDLATAMGRYRLAPGQTCANTYLMAYMARHSLTEVEGGWSWKFDPGILAHDRQDPAWWKRLPHRFAALDARKAIVHGRQSLLFTDDSAAYLRELAGEDLPVVGLVDAHHHLMLDQPVAYIAALEALLGAWVDEDARRWR